MVIGSMCGVLLWLHPCLLSEIFSVKLPDPFVVTDALSLSPGWTGLLKSTGDFGYIPYQA